MCIFTSALAGQTPLPTSLGSVRINNSDLAVLESQEVRKDLPCTVFPNKPTLGFDLRFHAGYSVNVHLNDLAGSENQLTILFRVIPEAHKDQPRYFIQHIHVPSIPSDAKGETTLSGWMDVGEGTYHVDWLLRDRSERVCSFYWDSEAVVPSKDKQMDLDIAAGSVQGMRPDEFFEEPPVARAAHPLSIKILVNFAPQYPDASTMGPMDTQALVTILRRLSREPRFGKFTLVAFNIQEERVIYRQADGGKIDFPALGKAIEKIRLGTTDPKRLLEKHGQMAFLADLLKQEMNGAESPDAVIFAGPKLMLDEGFPDDDLRPFAAAADFPVFYVNYNLYPTDLLWKDSISHAVKLFRGTEYSITRPRDVWFDLSEMVSRIVNFKHGRVGADASTSQ